MDNLQTKQTFEEQRPACWSEIAFVVVVAVVGLGSGIRRHLNRKNQIH